MFDRDFQVHKKEWIEGLLAWESKTDPDYTEKYEWWQWHGNPPDPEYYVPYKRDEATWFQVYETISEGTPVSPPFATEDELVDYLVANGDFWDQQRGDGPWSRKNAEQFVKGDRWRPTMIVADGKIQTPKDINFSE